MKVFLVGIGGIGVSALAQYLHAQGYEIYGSNSEQNEQTNFLIRQVQAKIFYEHDDANVPADIDFLVYSPAVPETNPERKYVQENNILEYSYPQYLGEISKQKKTIAVVGTNGKTTTTSMIGTILDAAGLDPTIIVGGIMPRYNSNCRIGQSEWFVVEACEYKESFMAIEPDYIVVTNITSDHLDHYKSTENYQSIFKRFVYNLKPGGKIIANLDDQTIQDLLSDCAEKDLLSYADLVDEPWVLPIPGRYNQENASAAVTLADEIGVKGAKALLQEHFQTSKRRFEHIGEMAEGALVYDDYAHNAQALALVIEAAKTRFPDKNLCVIFQPHLFSRTEEMKNEYVQALLQAEAQVLLPIYKARENPQDYQIRSARIVEQIPGAEFAPSVKECIDLMKEKNLSDEWVVLTVGAGDGNKVALGLVSKTGTID